MTIINNIEIDNIRYQENEIKKAILNNDPIEEKLHVIIVISNPCNFAIRYILTKEFIRRMKDDQNVILYIVELAYDNQEFYITELENKNHLRLRTNSTPIWHKENLVNIGVKKLLPVNWKAFAWIDADIEFENPTWALDTLKILNGCKDIVQLFSHTVFMDANGDTDVILTGLAFQYVKKTKRSNKIKEINSYWHPGFAWACTRKMYEKMEGLYEYAITGDGDMQMSSCFLSQYKFALPTDVSENYRKSLEDYEKRVTGCRLGYVPGVIRHHYHGSINSRKYDMREQILTKYDYSPTIHLTKDTNGLLIPTSLFPVELMNCILNHFQSKNEDDAILKKANISENQSGKSLTEDSFETSFESSFESTKVINLAKILEFHFKKPLAVNCVLINLKKDTMRLFSSREELKKLSMNIGTFTELDATYWEDSVKLQNDLNLVMNFLKPFRQSTNDTNTEQITINEFSEPSDTNIKIQSGPLACYCSHVKALMHGYLNFSDYTIIVEDDISIDDVTKIEKYIKLIPENWDIICLNSEQKGSRNIDPYYKFSDTFYHLHFYIIKNACMETLFRNIYPVIDQIDVLIGNMHDKLNIYNITNTASQKNFITNVQNNLHIIYNTPIYATLRADIDILKNMCYEKVYDYFPNNNCLFDESIVNKIMSDVVYNNIFGKLDEKIGHDVDKELHMSQSVQNCDKIFHQISKILKHFTKEHNISKFVSHLVDDIDYILNSFELHNTSDNVFHEKLQAYNFGSTSSVYISDISGIGTTIVKVYNDKLRWTRENHKNIVSIFEKELLIMKQLEGLPYLPHLINYDEEKLMLRMNYMGISLYDNYYLPYDWKRQIAEIFNSLTSKHIYYPEFNLNNIVVLNGIMSFVDFGLAELSEKSNTDNLKVFTKLLETLNEKYRNCGTQNKQILYNTFMNNMRQSNRYPNNVF